MKFDKFDGTPGQIRTADLLIRSQRGYLCSYHKIIELMFDRVFLIMIKMKNWKTVRMEASSCLILG
jgi:hypothetical protein